MARRGTGGSRNTGVSRSASGTPTTPSTATTPTTPVYSGPNRGENSVPSTGFSSPPIPQTTYTSPVGNTRLEFTHGTQVPEEGWGSKRPTNTINPPRPRTLAAAWDPNEETLYLCFRGRKQANGWADGAIYEYQNVSRETWREVRHTVSTGRFINSTLNHHPYSRID